MGGTIVARGAEVKTDDINLIADVSVDGTMRKNASDPLFSVGVPFLNPKESFELAFFFDGSPDDARVACRMEDVRLKIRKAESLWELASKLSFEFMGVAVRVRWP